MEDQNLQASTAVAAKPKGIKEWLSGPQFKQALAASLPSHLTAERFVRVALNAIMRTPLLAECSKESLFKAMLDLSSLGLEPDGRRAHLIPFRNNKAGTVEVQLIIDYKGLIELAKRSGEVESIRAELVCENDFFSWENGVVTHRIDFLKPRGKMQAVYSHVRNKNGIDEYEVMTREQVEAIKNRSRAGQNGPWVTDFDEMSKKTVIRRHSKKLTLSPEFHDALEKDDDKLDLGETNFQIANMMPKRLSEAEPAPSFQEHVPLVDEPLSNEERKQIKDLMKKNNVDEDSFLAFCKSIGIDVMNGEKVMKKDLAGIIKWIQMMAPAA